MTAWAAWAGKRQCKEAGSGKAVWRRDDLRRTRNGLRSEEWADNMLYRINYANNSSARFAGLPARFGMLRSRSRDAKST